MAKILSAIDDAASLLGTQTGAPVLEAQVLLAAVLACPRSHLLAVGDKLLAADEYAQFQQYIARRLTGVPVAYIVGFREFWSLAFKVTPAVLIPRPDSELLVQLGCDLVAKYNYSSALDLGTGSGAIAISLANECQHLAITASDNSTAALALAQINATSNAQSIKFIHSDWFKGIPPAKFSLITCNPPYIAAGDPHLQQGDLRFEPAGALVSGEDGLDAIRIVASGARDYLADGGCLLLEHGANQQEAVCDILRANGYHNITCHQDYGGNPRVTVGR